MEIGVNDSISDGISDGNSVGNEIQHVEFICEFPMEMIIIRVFYI